MKKYKKIILVFLIILLNSKTVLAEDTINYQINELGINSLITDIKKISNENIDLEDAFDKSIKGESSIGIVGKMIEITLGKEYKEVLKSISLIIAIIVIYGILKTISQSLGNNQTGRIGHFIQIIILITALLKIYISIIETVKQTIEIISNFTYMLLPTFISLSIATR